MMPDSLALDLRDRFTRLSPTERELLGLKSLIFFPASSSAFHTCVSRARLRGENGRVPMTQRATNELLERLVRKGFLDGDLVCVPAIEHRAAVTAVASASGDQMVAAVRAVLLGRGMFVYYHDRLSETERHYRAIRLAIYANDAAEFAANRQRLAPGPGSDLVASFLAGVYDGVPLEMDWLASRHPVIQSALLEAKFLVAAETGRPDPALAEMVAWYRERFGREGYGDYRHLLMRWTCWLAGWTRCEGSCAALAAMATSRVRRWKARCRSWRARTTRRWRDSAPR